MNKHVPFHSAAVPCGNPGVISPSPCMTPGTSTLVTMDARKVSGREFIDALGLSTPEQREARRQQSREQCIRAIESGNTYGFPPMLVAECREIIAERETGWALAERSAL